MALQQINLRVEESLLGSLKVLARERGLSLNGMAALAFERLLKEPVPAETGGGVERRILKLEQRLAALESKASPDLPSAAKESPDQAKPAPLNEPAKIPQKGEALTTAELATTTGTNRSAWNNWARDKNPGAIRRMKGDVGNWRYLGKTACDMGGPERGMWERA